MNIYRMKMTDSTNLEASRHKDAEDMSVWTALFQTEGRGQRGNVWESAFGENLTFSILFKPSFFIPASGQFVISQISSVGVASYLETSGLSPKIKWPNDIYIEDRKICGMLIENTISGDRLAAGISGIGLNLNQRSFSPELPNPTSLLLEKERAGGRPCPLYDSDSELERLLEHIFGYYRLAAGQEGRERIKKEYLARLYRMGKECLFDETLPGRPVRRFSGRIAGVDENTARLVIETADGMKMYAFKEIRYVI